jgi:hypothetical protein
VLAELAWILRAPVGAADVQRAVVRALRSDGLDLRVAIVAVGDRLELRTTIAIGPSRASKDVVAEIAGTRVVVRRTTAENAAAWYEICRLTDLSVRELGGQLEREPRPALYAVAAEGTPITEATPRFEPMDVAAALFSSCDGAPYATMEPIEEVIARVESEASRPGGYHPTLGSLLDWLFAMEAEGHRVVGSVLEPDSFTGKRTYELEER